MGETAVGTVVHFFHKPMVAAVRIEEGGCELKNPDQFFPGLFACITGYN